ncbi:MAG: UDP-N-acetylglucosamine 1-carboxyvinyltransferase [Actinomycetota bacterium]|nr:UDP-N-acetylglucosamine 1-carboxyvinyltransferase [Actinomycetota bacterium]MDA2971918.1 UDP-N-acetylglucosamine 1-carboxyvinyltransferase [Actinomycetota bacterium]
MSRIVAHRSGPLSGTVDVPGAKNSVLKLMVASLYASGEHRLTNVPEISDVEAMAALLSSLGVDVKFTSPGSHELVLVNGGAVASVAPPDEVGSIRASINLLGPLLACRGHVRLDMPGGDDFGSRPIDMHVAGLTAMGARFEVDATHLEARVDRLRGADVVLDYPSVGATENIMCAAVHADGSTTIRHAAREPEVADLARLLVEMGARIDGIGTDLLRIEGVPRGSLAPTTHTVVNDRIQAATYMAATAVLGGDIVVRGAVIEHMAMFTRKLIDMGVNIEEVTDGIRVSIDRRLTTVDVQTLPYPGVATDYKPLLVTMMAVADGVGVMTENLYPGRFRYVEELSKLGADIRTDGHHAVVHGVERLRGAAVAAPDIRAGAALVVAGLAAEGRTTISGIEHVERGYDDLFGRLSAIGARLERV